MLAGPHPRSLPLRRSLTRSSRRPQALFNARGAPPPLAAAASLEDSLLAAAAGAFQCSRDPTPARCRCVARRLAPRGGRRRFSVLAGPHPRSLPLRRSKTRSSRRPQALFSARGAPPPLALARRLRASLGPAFAAERLRRGRAVARLIQCAGGGGPQALFALMASPASLLS